MKVKEILKIACDFIGNSDICAALEQSQPLSAAQQQTWQSLIKCLDLVQNEVATQFVPLEKIEEVEAVDFRVAYSSFSKTPIAFVWAKDKFGRNLRFKAFADHFMVFGGKVRVKYCYLPKSISSDEQEMDEKLLPARIYAYGIAREWFLLQSLGDDADIWEARFKDGIAAFAKKRKEIKMPCKRWI